MYNLSSLQLDTYTLLTREVVDLKYSGTEYTFSLPGDLMNIVHDCALFENKSPRLYAAELLVLGLQAKQNQLKEKESKIKQEITKGTTYHSVYNA